MWNHFEINYSHKIYISIISVCVCVYTVQCMSSNCSRVIRLLCCAPLLLLLSRVLFSFYGLFVPRTFITSLSLSLVLIKVIIERSLSDSLITMQNWLNGEKKWKTFCFRWIEMALDLAELSNWIKSQKGAEPHWISNGCGTQSAALHYWFGSNLERNTKWLVHTTFCFAFEVDYLYIFHNINIIDKKLEVRLELIFFVEVERYKLCNDLEIFTHTHTHSHRTPAIYTYIHTHKPT